MNWELLPFDGIECDGIKISFGSPRDLLRNSMASHFQPLKPNNAYPDEDDFISQDGSTFIRVRYDDHDAVWDIEVLQGTLRYCDVELHDQTTMEQIRRSFTSKGIPFRPTEWLGDGWDCVTLGINIASREDVGGDGDEIEWVILSRAFRS